MWIVLAETIYLTLCIITGIFVIVLLDSGSSSLSLKSQSNKGEWLVYDNN